MKPISGLAELAAVSTFAAKPDADDAPAGCGITDKHSCHGLWIEGAVYTKGCEKRPRGKAFGMCYANVVAQPVLDDDLLFVFDDDWGSWRVTVTGSQTELGKLGRFLTQARMRTLHVGGGVTAITVSKAG